MIDPTEPASKQSLLSELMAILPDVDSLPLPDGAIEDVHSRFERAKNRGRSLRLSSQDVDILAAIGIGHLVALASATANRELAIERIYARAGVARPSAGSHPSRDTEHVPPAPRAAKPVGDIPYSIASLAKRWRCSTTHVRNQIRLGELEAFQIGRMYRIRPETVKAYEDRRG